LTGLGVVGSVPLLELGLMALGTVLGRDDDGDQSFLVHEAIYVALLGLVTVQTVDSGLAVGAMVPFQIQPRVFGHKAIAGN
jgi:hypothetical protein